MSRSYRKSIAGYVKETANSAHRVRSLSFHKKLSHKLYRARNNRVDLTDEDACFNKFKHIPDGKLRYFVDPYEEFFSYRMVDASDYRNVRK